MKTATCDKCGKEITGLAFQSETIRETDSRQIHHHPKPPTEQNYMSENVKSHSETARKERLFCEKSPLDGLWRLRDSNMFHLGCFETSEQIQKWCDENGYNLTIKK